jgi:RHS repeat-associated protein
MAAQTGTVAVIDQCEHASPLRSFRFEQAGPSASPIVKRFALPARIPYDVSQAGFSIVVQDTELADLMEKMIEERTQSVEAGAVSDTSKVNPLSSTDVATQGAVGTVSTMTTLSIPRTGSYYIYAFDGRLLAEYDMYGACLRDYIYMGSRLIAEFVPATGQYFYYRQDQIGSTRVVTDDSGSVVYAEAHDPYGGVQKTWPGNTFDPKRKFSDKERDAETGLDYFGARYYSAPVRRADGHSSGNYRWLSVDPVITERAINNPQEWNLYSYSRNNPTSFFDPVGKSVLGIGGFPGLAACANFIASCVMIHEALNFLYGYISTQRALATLINNPTTGVSEWIGTDYDLVGEGSKIGISCDCSGSAFKIIKGGGFPYKYRRANQDFLDSLIMGGINEGVLGAIPKGWSPQPGDIGYWDGHMCIYAYRQGGKDYVFNASEKADKFQIQRLDGIVNYFGGTQPVWYRLRTR